MDKKIEDYLHLYLGCDCFIPKYDRNEKLIQISHESKLGYFRFSSPDFDGWAEFKPLLRQLSDMSEEEEFEWSENGHKEADPMMAEAEATRYLLSKHFDLFGLIEAGLAMDKTQQ